MQRATHPSYRRGQDPNLGLERALGNGHELDQKHILEVHEPFPNFPPFISRSIHLISLESSYEPQSVEVFAVM